MTTASRKWIANTANMTTLIKRILRTLDLDATQEIPAHRLCFRLAVYWRSQLQKDLQKELQVVGEPHSYRFERYASYTWLNVELYNSYKLCGCLAGALVYGASTLEPVHSLPNLTPYQEDLHPFFLTFEHLRRKDRVTSFLWFQGCLEHRAYRPWDEHLIQLSMIERYAPTFTEPEELTERRFQEIGAYWEYLGRYYQNEMGVEFVGHQGYFQNL